jgi:hypothetical protein
MKIRITKRKGSVSIRFSAGRAGHEGVDLKDAVLKMGLPQETDSIVRIAETLAEKGYHGVLTKDTPNVKEFEVSKT